MAKQAHYHPAQEIDKDSIEWKEFLMKQGEFRPPDASALRSRRTDQMDGTLPTPLGGGLMRPVGPNPNKFWGDLSPKEIQASRDIRQKTLDDGREASQPAPQRVTAHTESPWDASISELFNNDNWSQQYDGTNPKSDNPMRSGNWYTPGGGSSAQVNTAPTAAGGSAINNDPRVQQLAKQYRTDYYRDLPPQTVVPVDSLDTQDRLDIPGRVDQSQDVTPKPEGGGWDLERLFGAGQDLYDSAKGGAGDLMDFVGDLVPGGVKDVASGAVEAVNDTSWYDPQRDLARKDNIVDNIMSPVSRPGFNEVREIYQQIMLDNPDMPPHIAAENAAYATDMLRRPVEGASEDQGSNFYMDNVHDPINKYFAGGGAQRGWKYIKDLGN